MTLLDMALPYQREVIMDGSRVKVLNFSRQIGKSWTAAFLSSLQCCRKPGSLVLYLSTGLRAASEALRTCLKFAEAVRSMSGNHLGYSSNATTLTFSNGSRIMSLPGRPESCRGWSADLLVLDEMAFWPTPDETWQAIVPTILNPLKGRDKQILVCSTPLARNSLFYDLCVKARETEGWRYFQTTVEDAKGQGLDIDIDSLHRLIPDPNRFACEFMCQFADQASPLVPLSDLVFTDSDFAPDETFMGADWARSSDGTALAVVGRRRRDGMCRLVELTVLHGMDYKRQMEVARRMYESRKPRLFLGDATGLGGPLVEQLNREVSARIKPFTFTHRSKNEAYEYFRKQVLDRKVEFDVRFREEVTEDLLLVQQLIDESGNVSYSASRRGNSHADAITAVILALQAERQSRAGQTVPSATGIHSIFHM